MLQFITSNQYMDSREVAKSAKKQHKNLLRDIEGYISILDQSPNLGDDNYTQILASSSLSPLDYFIESSYLDAQGKIRKCYLITRKGCEMIAHKITGKRGIQFTAFYIDYFHQMEQSIKRNEYEIPQTLGDALRLAAHLADDKAKLVSEAKRNEPLVLYAKKVKASKGSVTIGELSKWLTQNGIKIGQNRLFDCLRENKFLISTGENKNQPTQYSMERKWFELDQKMYTDKLTGENFINSKTKVTPKGQIYFFEWFEKRQNKQVS